MAQANSVAPSEPWLFEGDCPLGAGEQTVKVTVSPEYDDVRGFKGTITWKIETAEFVETIGTTLAEVYFILDKPIKVFDSKGVWVEALRFLCYHITNVKAKNEPQDIIKRITVIIYTGSMRLNMKS